MLRLALVLGWLLGLASPGLAQIPARPEGALLVDYAKALTPATADSLTNSLQSFQQRSHHSLVVVVVKRMAPFRMGNSIEGLALLWFDQWGLAPSDLLLLVSLDDHKARIQLGKAWGTSADARCREIMAGMVERFKANDVDGALNRGCSGLEQMELTSAPVAAPAAPPVAAPAGPPGLKMEEVLSWFFSWSLFSWQVATMVVMVAVTWTAFALYSNLTAQRRLPVLPALLVAAAATVSILFWLVMAGFVVWFFLYCAANSSGSSSDDQPWRMDTQSNLSYSSSDSYSSPASSSDSSSSYSDSGGATGTW